MDEAVNHLLDIHAVQPVPAEEQGQGFYSILFVVPKASGGWRAILDLKRLNRFIKYRRFKMHSLHSILANIRKGDLLASLDLTEAYLHIPISKPHRQYLRFYYAGRHLQYRALPFGLSSAPRVFTKILASLAASLRTVPIRLQCYLDDILVQAHSPGEARINLAKVITSLETHGFSINRAKSHLCPSTTILHLGTIIDTEACRVSLSPERKDSIRSHVLQIQGKARASIASLSSLLGKFISCLYIVPWARLHSRQLQWLLLPFQRAGRSTSLAKIRLPPKVRLSLAWWLSPALSDGSLFKEPTRLTVTTDASLTGWGAHSEGNVAQGLWTRQETTASINWLELRAVRLALQTFTSLVQHHHVLVMTDNTTCMAHINRQGGTRSQALMQEALSLGLWAERHLQSLTAIHIAGIANTQADQLSRSTIDPNEWQLHPSIFQELETRFGRPKVDLFALPHNSQLPRFFSRFPSPGAEGVDALRTSWPRGLLS